jgi:hypothetical protein
MARNAKGLQGKSKGHTVEQISGYTFNVTSGTSGAEYTVRLAEDLGRPTCTCDWAKYRPARTGHVCGCSHVVSVYRWMAAEANGARVSVWASEADARRQHHTVLVGGFDGLWVTARIS